jgi:prepilin-type processing-associated H-X9-DG protein
VACLHSDAAAGIPGGFGFGIAIAVEKPDLLRKTLKTGFERLQAVTQNNVTAAEEERAGRPVWVFDLGQLPFHPAAALDKHWLFIGLTPQAVESSLLRVDGKLDRWKPSEAEQEALNSVPKEFIALSLSDPRPMYGTAVAYLPILASVINQAAETAAARTAGDRDKPPAKRAAGKRMALLADIPPAEVLTRPMFPNVSVGTVDAKGVRFQSRDSVPGFTMGGFVSAPVLVALLLPAVQAAREAARRTESKNHIKQLALAMHNYHDANGSFPAGTHPNPQLKPEKRLSWLVDLLPYVEFKQVYDEIDFKKPWDDPANRKAVELPLALFLNPSVGEQKVNGLPVTEYIGMAGVGADGPTLPVTSPRAGVFAYDRMTRIQDIMDGTSNTIMISECNKDLGSWAAGGRATIRALSKKPYIDGPDGLGGHPEGMQVGFADGSVRFISKQIDPTVIEALTTINGGETIALPTPP